MSGWQSQQISLLLVDIDRFDGVPEKSADGDVREAILDATGDRLRSVLRPNQMLARLANDEFAVVLPDAGAEVATRVAHDLARQLERPIVAPGVAEMLVRVCIGSASALVPFDNPWHLLGQATEALSVARARGGGISHFDTDVDAPVYTRARSELQVALEHAEVEVFCQPQIDLHTGLVRGAEALARWRHPRDGVLLPAAFLPLAARTGLLRPITSAVLTQSLDACAAWWENGHRVPISVNLTPPDLLDQALTEQVLALLRSRRLPAEALRLEVTEEVFISDTGPVAVSIEAWRREGVQIALDDFGTGYSSLAYLRALPISELKLDKVFISDLSRARTATIVRHTIAMAHDLGIEVVAEGVEDEATAALLRDLGCDVGQGLHFGDAMPPMEFRAYLTSSKHPATARER